MTATGIENTIIVGAGWVGRQIAARMAQHGLYVCLVDRSETACSAAAEWIASQADIDGEAVQRTQVVHGLEESQGLWPEVHLVLESVSEQLSLKKRVLREISRRFAPPTIIASNSSYFVPSLLRGFVSNSERFAHMHFHHPVTRQTVCDIVGHDSTDPSVLRCLADLAQRMEQPPLMLRREHPGYIFNWLLQSVLRSALELVALDVADPADIDRSWKAVTGMPLGPFGMMDEIGLDVIEQVLSNSRWAVAPEVDVDQLLSMLRARTSAGHLGVKSGCGFYEYSSRDLSKAD